MVAPRSTKPLLLVAATGLLLATQLFLISPASAHGSVSNPPSRTYLCRFNQPDAGACGRAWAANPQALYDWMEVNIGDVAGNHRARIPDGKLCSAGRAKYAAFDEPAADWPTTPLTPDANGRYRIAYEASAPHATEYFRLYVTSADYQPTDPLAWGDLELVHDSGRLSAQPSYQFEFTLPARSGHHILFQVWQRSDSPEAFYSCSDVLLGGGPAPAPTTTTAAPTTTAPSTTTAPTRPTTPTTVDSTTSAPASTSSTAPSTTAAPPRPTTSLPVTSAPSTTSVNASSTSARPTTTTLSSTTLDRETSSIPAPSGAGRTDDAVAPPPSLPTSSTSQPLGEAGQAATTVVPTSPSSTALTSAPAAANEAQPRAATDLATSTAANKAAVATTSDADSGRLPLPVIIGGGLLASIVLGGAAAIAIRRRWPWLGWNQPVLLTPAVNRPRNR